MSESPLPDGSTQPWMTMPQAMAYLQVSRTTLYRLMEDGTLPFYRISSTRQRRFQKSDLDKLMILETPASAPVSEDEETKDMDT